MGKAKPGWQSDIDAYKKQLQDRSLDAVREKKADAERAEERRERAASAPRKKGFGRRGVD